MSVHAKVKVVQLICGIICFFNVLTGVVLYAREYRDGFTIRSAGIRRSIKVCTVMAFTFGVASIALGIYNTRI